MLTSERKKPKRSKIRYAEYYDLQKTLDSLYADSLKGKVFVRLIQDTYRVIVDNNTDINCASDPNIVDVREICPACAKRIHQTVRELKQEG